MSNHYNFSYGFPSKGCNPFFLNSNLNESGLISSLLRRASNHKNIGHNQNDLGQFTYEERRRNLSPYLLHLQNIRDNLPPQYQPVFHGAEVTETKPTPFLTATSTMDRHLPPISNPNGSSSLNQVPGFHEADVTMFNRANVPDVQPDMPRRGRVSNFSVNQSVLPSVPTSAKRDNRIGARRDELLISPSPLSVHYRSEMKDQSSSSDHNQVHGSAKTLNSDYQSNKTQVRDVSPANSSTHRIPGPEEAPHNQVMIGLSSGLGIANIPHGENEVKIRRIKNDGRIHSLPHKKNGPYYCPFPECKGLVFPTAQTFGVHTLAYHYSGETIEERKRREAKKYGTAKNKLSLVSTAYGITVMPNSLNYKPITAGRIEKNARGKAKIGVQINDNPWRFPQYEAAIKQTILNGVNIKPEPM